ncbi:MAG TPA: cupin domain-containing protein [Terrimicrobiaceae bacterium]
MKASPRGSLFKDQPDATQGERFEELCRSRSFRIERITSSGQSSPSGFWYDQAWDEWVLVLQGSAIVQLQEPQEAVRLCPGDWLMINAHRKHRVDSTSQESPTLWLAVHAIPSVA